MEAWATSSQTCEAPGLLAELGIGASADLLTHTGLVLKCYDAAAGGNLVRTITGCEAPHKYSHDQTLASLEAWWMDTEAGSYTVRRLEVWTPGGVPFWTAVLDQDRTRTARMRLRVRMEWDASAALGLQPAGLERWWRLAAGDSTAYFNAAGTTLTIRNLDDPASVDGYDGAGANLGSVAASSVAIVGSTVTWTFVFEDGVAEGEWDAMALGGGGIMLVKAVQPEGIKEDYYRWTVTLPVTL